MVYEGEAMERADRGSEPRWWERKVTWSYVSIACLIVRALVFDWCGR